ncbi:hypothetical protein AAF712_012399 [Marasmius tenuissimus]|uniref:FBD domain-containing protein n=1 Tax=Marasmius tenuissimus TaxID=585030 RepID=A0ABR2ZGT0_9AGAR
MVQRSRSLPLHIHLDEQSVVKSPCSFSSLVRRTFPRMKIFECHVDKTETLRVVIRHLQKYPAPNLESLTLQVLYPFHSHPSVSEPPHFPAFGRNDPIALDWLVGYSCHLTSLKLVLGDLPVSLTQLATLIQRCPLLEHLILRDVFVCDSRDLEKPAMAMIDLPRLKALEIGGSSSHTLLLLADHIVISPYSTVSVLAHFPHLPLASLPSLCKLTERACRGREIRHVECSADDYDEGATVLKVYGGGLTIATFEGLVMGSILRCFSSAAVDAIILDTYGLSEASLRPYFRLSSGLQMVKVGNRSRLNFLQVLDRLDHTPCFTTVVLVAWQDFEDYPGDSEDAMPVYRDLVRLARILGRRRCSDTSSPLREIILEGFHMCSERKVSTILSEVAQNVLWRNLD